MTVNVLEYDTIETRPSRPAQVIGPLGDGAGVVDVAAGAAGPGPPDRLAMVVELEGDPDHLGAGARGEGCDDRAVDPAGHGDDDARLGGRPVELEIGDHGGRYIGRKGEEAQTGPVRAAPLTPVNPSLRPL